MRLYYETHGNKGSPVVLLHGMAASRRYWDELIKYAPQGEFIFYAIDLPGFGRSPQPRGLAYDYQMYSAAIIDTLHRAGIHEKVTVTGHSMGSLLALRLAVDHPERIHKIVACNVPYYPDSETAKKEITQSTKIRELAYYGFTSRILCTVWCSWMRPITSRVAPYYLPALPKRVAQDTVLHTWEAYSKSLSNIIEAQQVASDIKASKVSTVFIYGSNDGCLSYFKDSGLIDANRSDKFIVVDGSGHQIPLDAPEIVIDALRNN